MSRLMLVATSRLRSPSTLHSCSKMSRIRTTSASVNLLTLVSLLTFAFCENSVGRGSSNPVDVREGDLSPFILWKIDSCNACHRLAPSSLFEDRFT